MRIYVSAAGFAPFQVDVDEEWQIGHLKEVIESMLIHPLWTAATMGLFNGNIELENASTLQQNSITESSTLHAFLPYEAQVDDTLWFPANDDNTISNHGDDPSTGNIEFTMDDLMGMPPPPVDMKMILPQNFQANTPLNYSGTHHFRTSGQLREKIDNDLPAWLPKLEAYAILSNANVFLAENVDDYENRKNGGVALVRSAEYENFHQGRGYKLSVEAPAAISIEKSAGKFKISGEITLDRFEIVGDIWTRRRIQVTGDDTFSLIQWMATVPKRKDTVKEQVSNAVKAVEDLKLQLDTVAKDVTEIKTDVKVIKQDLTSMQTALSAIFNRLPHQPPPDPST